MLWSGLEKNAGVFPESKKSSSMNKTFKVFVLLSGA
jgi:hypothetical protein